MKKKKEEKKKTLFCCFSLKDADDNANYNAGIDKMPQESEC